MFKRLTAVVASAIFLFVLSLIAGAGEWIAFQSGKDGGPGKAEIYVMRPDGTEVRNVTNNPTNDTLPAWLPDGRLAFTSIRNNHSQVLLMDIRSEDVTSVLLRDIAAYATFSPDGARVAFVDGWSGRIASTRLDGTDFQWVSPQENGNPASSPWWSPRGDQILYQKNDNRTNSQVFVAGIDGREDRALTETPAPRNVNHFDAAWSPDGERIVYGAIDYDTSDINIWTMDANGNDQHILVPNTFGDSFVWSPNGARIAFSGEGVGGGGDIFIMNANGSGLHNVTNTPWSEAFLSWFDSEFAIDLPVENPSEDPGEPRAVKVRGKLPTVWGTLKSNK